MPSPKPFAQILCDPTGTTAGLFGLIDTAVAAGAKSLFLLACDANGFTPEAVDAKLRSVGVPVFGGIFPQLVSGSKTLLRGTIVCGLPVPATVETIERLSDPAQDYLIQTSRLPGRIPPGAALVTLVDGLSTRISALLESLYDALGSDHPYVGGGAGSLSFVQKPCLFSNSGLLVDCAQITALELRMQVGIEHGWQRFAGPFFVTGAEHNTIHSLDYRPAFEVYREVVEAASGRRFEDTNFFQLAQGYPFGVARLNRTMVVRDPLLREGDSLVCVGEVPPNQMVYILKGDADCLLEASVTCAQTAIRSSDRGVLALLFDCISRTLFLKDRFPEELENIGGHLPTGVPLLGALSLGEIADAHRPFLEFFNKTIVLGILSQPERPTV